MNIALDDIRKQAPEGATHYWQNEYGHAYYCYCEQIKRWLYYDKHHDCWFSQRETSIKEKLKPLN